MSSHILRLVVGVCCAALSGCAHLHRQPSSPPLENPLTFPMAGCDAIWDDIIDVIDDDFDVLTEQRVHQAGDVYTVGRIETLPKIGATYLEPWRHDAADSYERLHGTLQSLRRRAIVQVIPTGDQFQVEVVVFKELEDLPRAEYSTVGEATFRNDGSMIRVEQPVGVQPLTLGWLPLGRDAALEQQILTKIAARVQEQTGARSVSFPGLSSFGFGPTSPTAVDGESIMRPPVDVVPTPDGVPAGEYIAPGAFTPLEAPSSP